MNQNLFLFVNQLAFQTFQNPHHLSYMDYPEYPIINFLNIKKYNLTLFLCSNCCLFLGFEIDLENILF